MKGTFGEVRWSSLCDPSPGPELGGAGSVPSGDSAPVISFLQASAASSLMVHPQSNFPGLVLLSFLLVLLLTGAKGVVPALPWRRA